MFTSWLKKRWTINLCLLMGSALITIFLIEIVLRFTPYKNVLIQAAHPRYYYVADNTTGYDIIENFPESIFKFKNYSHKLWSNNLGCFDKEYKEDGRKYILLLGDSFTWGYTSFEDKWGRILEIILDRRVLKCGVSGYGTKQEFIKAERIIKKTTKKPALLVVGYFVGNDILDDYLFPRRTVVDGYLFRLNIIKDINTGEIEHRSEDKIRIAFSNFSEYGTEYVPPYPLIQKMKDFFHHNSILYSSLPSFKKRVKRVSLKVPLLKNSIKKGENIAFLMGSEYSWAAKVWDNHFSNLKEFKKFADSIGAKMLIVVIPIKELVYPFLKDTLSLDDLSRHQVKVVNFLLKEGIDYIDLTSLFRKYANQTPRNFLDAEHDFYWPFSGHWNIKGNHLAGLLVAQNILEKNLIEVEGKEEKLKEIKNKLYKFEKK
jgi:hypothetical protein